MPWWSGDGRLGGGQGFGGRIGFNLGVRGETIDQFRKFGGDVSGGLFGIDTELGGQVVNRTTAQNLVDLIGADQGILSRTHPAGEHFAGPAVLKLLGQPGKAAVGFKEIVEGLSLVAGDGIHHTADQVIK